MPKINPDKSYVQVPLRLGKLDSDVTIEMPYGWLTALCLLVADKILNLNDHDKQNFIANMDRLSGPDATYTLKAPLHESMIVIYEKLASAKLSPDQKVALATKLVEGVKNCGPGFHDRINEAVESLSVPENVDDLLSILRHAIVSNAASQVTDEVHTKNRFSVIANVKGYGIRPFNEKDVYHGTVFDYKIVSNLKEAFDNHYTLFTILNGLQEQIQAYAKSKGYQGERKEGYPENDIDEAGYRHFINDQMRKSLDISCEEFLLAEDGDDGISFRIVDIDWLNVKKALLKKLREEQYFTFEPQEEALLKWMESGASPLELPPEALSLFATPNELVQALVFFKEWPTGRKLELIHYYLDYLANDKFQAEKVVLEKLEKIPELYREVTSDPVMRKKYLRKAVCEKKLDKVKALVASGEDDNPYFLYLMSIDEKFALYLLLSDAAVRATITRDNLEVIAETLVSSKKGRQILLMDERLRGMCPDMLADKTMSEWMQQAEAEKVTRMRDGFFAPVNPLVKQFLKHIIYGEQAQAEKILKGHPQMALELLTTKLIVKDYSGRKIIGTALQLAAGAEDVRYYEYEICMVEMLTPYIKSLPDGEKIMATQIAEQFPEGYEEQERQRIQADEAALRAVVDAIGASANDAACEAALQTFYEYLKPKGVIKTGKHFYTQLLETAFALYGEKFEEFDGFDSRKNNMFWQKVIGYIQRYLPANYAQAFCQGLYDIVGEGGGEGEWLSRSLEFQYDNGVKFFPLDLNPALRLGVDYAASWVGRRSRGGRAAQPSFAKLCQTKNKNIGTTYAAARETIRHMRGNVAMF